MFAVEALHTGGDQGGKLIRSRFLGGIVVPGGNQVGKSGVRIVSQGSIERHPVVPAAPEEIPIAVAGQVEGDAVEPGGQGGLAATIRTGASVATPAPIRSPKNPRTCSKCRIASRPLFSPAVVNTSKCADRIFIHWLPSRPVAGKEKAQAAMASLMANHLMIEV